MASAVVDFGSEISCVQDIAADGRPAVGSIIVGEACMRRLLTPRGRLIDDPNYGFDLTGYVHDDMGPRDIAALQVGATAECLKDERVQSADVKAVLTAAGLLTVTIALTTSLGPFRLVLSVSSTTFSILSVT